MKITKRQLRRIVRESGRSEHHAEARGMAAASRQGYNDGSQGLDIDPHHARDPEYLRGYKRGAAETKLKEAEGSTVKYNADPALKGDQTTLPDRLQKGIIDKANKESTSEGKTMKVTKRQLKRIIDEAWTSADDGAQYADNEVRNALRPQVEKMLQDIYIGGYRADGAQSLFDMLEDVAPGQSKRTVEAMLYAIANMMKS